MSTFKDRLQMDGQQIASSQVVVPTAEGLDTDGTLIGGTGDTGTVGLFTFATPVRIARIVKRSGCAADILIAINQDTVTATNWQEELETDEKRLTIAHPDLLIDRLALISDVDVVFEDDFVVYGWK